MPATAVDLSSGSTRLRLASSSCDVGIPAYSTHHKTIRPVKNSVIRTNVVWCFFMAKNRFLERSRHVRVRARSLAARQVRGDAQTEDQDDRHDRGDHDKPEPEHGLGSERQCDLLGGQDALQVRSPAQ